MRPLEWQQRGRIRQIVATQNEHKDRNVCVLFELDKYKINYAGETLRVPLKVEIDER